ncbi:MAG: hypothetical protein HIU84_01490 [Acidobacteria bacterium]|nr:hypothetical protein [Acidobacteriota bacterium]
MNIRRCVALMSLGVQVLTTSPMAATGVAGASSVSMATVAAFGAPYRGAPLSTSPAVVALATTSDGHGYYVLRSNGEVDAFGVASYGSVRAGALTGGVTATGIAYDAATGGYWVVSSDGRVRGFYAPNLGGPHIHAGGWGQYASAVAIASTSDGRGYYVLRANGGVEGFGVPWHGSLAGRLTYGATAPVVAVGIATDPATGGYWVATSNGRVTGFDAPVARAVVSNTGATSAMPTTAIASGVAGAGYYVLHANGTVAAFQVPARGSPNPATITSIGAMASGIAVDPATGGYYEAFDLTPLGGYLNPLRQVEALVPQEIDQGVDYCGSGPVYSIGAGVVKNVFASDWPSGVFIAYQLTSGPAKGLAVYVAENVTPRVSVGERLSAQSVVGILHDAKTCMETGWADVRQTNGHVMGHLQFNGKNSTSYGLNFSAFLQTLGARPGLPQHFGPPGPIASSWPKW